SGAPEVRTRSLHDALPVSRLEHAGGGMTLGLRTSESMNDQPRMPATIEVSDKDSPLHCPTPVMALWNAHPRVFLDIERSGEAMGGRRSARLSSGHLKDSSA